MYSGHTQYYYLEALCPVSGLDVILGTYLPCLVYVSTFSWIGYDWTYECMWQTIVYVGRDNLTLSSLSLSLLLLVVVVVVLLLFMISQSPFSYVLSINHKVFQFPLPSLSSPLAPLHCLPSLLPYSLPILLTPHQTTPPPHHHFCYPYSLSSYPHSSSHYYLPILLTIIRPHYHTFSSSCSPVSPVLNLELAPCF